MLAGALALAPSARAGAFTLEAHVVEVIDGDTVRVALGSGKVERVRLIGVDTPEVGECGAAKATDAARRIAGGQHVTLKGDATQPTRDRYGRRLAYVWIRGRDLGFQLLDRGLATVYVTPRPFRRLTAYRAAESRARDARRGGWGAAACFRPAPSPPPPPAPSAGCHPSYSPCVPDVPYDIDCADIGFTVRVVGSDEYRLDGDGDGYGCE